MSMTLSVSPSIPMLVPADYIPSLSVSALDTVADVGFGDQATISVTSLLGTTTVLNEGTDYSYNSTSDEVLFYYPLSNSDIVQFSVAPDYSQTDLSTQFSDLGVAPAEGSNLRDKQLLQMAKDLDSRILALGGQSSGGGGAGVTSIVVGDSSYNGTIQFFAGSSLSFIEGADGFQLELDQDIQDAPGNITSLSSTVGDISSDLSGLTTTVSNIRQVPDAATATVGHVLTVNNSNVAEWQAATGGAGGGATTISGLSDVTLSTLTDGDLLVASGGSFINAAAPYLTSSDVATVATSGSYNDLSDTPTVPTTTGTWELETDRPLIKFEALQSSSISAGHTWRWNGSQFVAAPLDIADVTTSGNQPLADFLSGTREPVAEYANADAEKVLAVNASATALEWVANAPAAIGAPAVQVWQGRLDNSGGNLKFGEFGIPGSWDWRLASGVMMTGFGTDENFDVTGWFEDLTVGPALGTFDTTNGIMTITDAGTYRINYSLSVAWYDSNTLEVDSADLAILKMAGATTDPDTDTLLIRDSFQGQLQSNADETVSFSKEQYVSLAAGDKIYMHHASFNPSSSFVGPFNGTWIIEKVG